MVDRYVRGEFSPEERRRLDAEIAECDPCQKKLRTELEIAAGIRREGRDAMKAVLRKKIRRERALQFTSFQWIGLAAAIVIIAVGVGLFQVWFGDMQRPTQFRQEIVLTPQNDSAGNVIPPASGEERSGGSGETSSPALAESRRTDRPAEPAPDELAESISEAEAPAVNGAVDDTRSVAARESAAEAKDAAVNEESSAIWLIGEVVMIPQSRGMAGERSLRSTEIPAGATPEGAAMEKSEQGKMRVTTQRAKKNTGIVLHRAPTRELPVGRQQSRSARSNEVEIQLTRSKEGLAVTLYSDEITESALNEISVESPADDSLVVTLPNQRISLHLPAGWNIPAARRR